MTTTNNTNASSAANTNSIPANFLPADFDKLQGTDRAASSLRSAKRAKDDEFYTRYNTVAAELDNYADQLAGKTIFCPCDDPTWSNFVKYFVNNRDKLNNTIYASCYYPAADGGITQVTLVAAKRGNPASILCREDYRRPRTEVEQAIKTKMLENGYQVGRETQITILEKKEQLKIGSQLLLDGIGVNDTTNKGDFEKTATFDLLLSACNVVVTNPPFSKWNDLFNVLLESGKKFLILGGKNAATNKNVFEAIKQGKCWTGHGDGLSEIFDRPAPLPPKDKVGVSWYTNLYKKPSNAHSNLSRKGYTVADLKARGLWKVFDERPDVLCIDRADEVPVDYEGLLAVPFTKPSTYLDCGRFELVEGNNFCNMKVNGSAVYARVVVRQKTGRAAEIAEEAKNQEILIKATPDLSDGRGYVYVLTDGDAIKIGVTNRPLEDRIHELQTGNPRKIRRILLSNPVYNYKEVEAEVHAALAADRLRADGEWFNRACLADACALITERTSPSTADVKAFKNI